jgi:hypothetical protein
MNIIKNISFQPQLIIDNEQKNYPALDNIKILEKIFLYLTKQEDWKACCLTSKTWEKINKSLRPLTQFVNAITNKDTNTIRQILNINNYDYLHLKISGSRYCPNVDQTPLIRAREYKLPESIIELLEKKDAGFTKKFLNWKLFSLRFDISPNLKIKECSFSGEGLDHFSHHNYLLPDLINSLKNFFNQLGDTPNWDKNTTSRLLKAIRSHPCTICPNEGILKKIEKVVKAGNLIIFSQSVNEHKHWITFAMLGSFLILGNRGIGSHGKPGIQIYKISEQFTLQNLGSLFHPSIIPKPEHVNYVSHVALPKQKTGSCARLSLEAGILAGIFLLLNEKNDLLSNRSFKIEECLEIFNEWRQSDQERSIELIISKKNPPIEELLMLGHIFANCDASASCDVSRIDKIYQFLTSSIQNTYWKFEDLNLKKNLIFIVCQKLLEIDVKKAAQMALLATDFTNEKDSPISFLIKYICTHFPPYCKDSALEALVNHACQAENIEIALEATHKIENPIMRENAQIDIIETVIKKSGFAKAFEIAQKIFFNHTKRYAFYKIALDSVLKGNKEETHTLLNKIRTLSTERKDYEICCVCEELYSRRKIELCCEYVLRIESPSDYLPIIAKILTENLKPATEITLIKKVLECDKKNLSTELLEIANILLKKNNLKHALDVID